jgi:hypothetical protein
VRVRHPRHGAEAGGGRPEVLQDTRQAAGGEEETPPGATEQHHHPQEVEAANDPGSRRLAEPGSRRHSDSPSLFFKHSKVESESR